MKNSKLARFIRAVITEATKQDGNSRQLSVLLEVSDKDRLRKALVVQIKNNDPSKLEELLPEIEMWIEQGKYKKWLELEDGVRYAYRLLDFTSEKQLKTILGEESASEVDTETYKVLPGGILNPRPGRQLSSWTINPRSLLYSGFVGVISKNKNFLLVKAKIKGNKFFGNPETMDTVLPKKGEVESYSLEREVIGIGPITYEKAIYGFKKPGQSLEGLLMDLVNKVSNIKDYDLEKKKF